MSPALAGRFLTAEPTREVLDTFFSFFLILIYLNTFFKKVKKKKCLASVSSFIK